MMRRASLAFAVISVGGGLISSPGLAQFVDSSDRANQDNQIEEVIVFGTKRGLTLQEAEVSVEVFTSQRIDDESLFRLDELLQRTPNVQERSIRGISRFGIGGAGQGVTSNVYLDGAPSSNDALGFGIDSLWDIGQVEVLRGPQSTVQGRNALAGSIVMRTKDPSFEREGALRMRAAEYDTYQMAGVISGPLIADTLAARFSADWQETRGYITNAFTGEPSDEGENLGLRGKLLYTPDGERELRALLTVDYNKNESAPQNGVVFSEFATNDPAFPDFDFYDFVSFSNPEFRENETTRVIADLSLRLNDVWALRAIGTYERNDLLRTRGDPDNPGASGASADESFIIPQVTDTYSAELRFEYDLARWSGSVGAYYFEDDQDAATEFFSPLSEEVFFPIDPPDTLVTGRSTRDTSTRNYAGYIQARFNRDDYWTFDFSARYDVERYETTGNVNQTQSVSPIDCIATLPDFVQEALEISSEQVPCLELVLRASQIVDSPDQSDEFSAFLPRLAVTYTFNDDLAVFVSAQRGYRAGGTYLQLTTEGQQVRAYDPEYLDNVEIGMRSTWFERRLTLNANAFYSILEDQQVTVPGPSGTFTDAQTVNAGETEIYGLEASAEYRWSADLNLYASLGLLETEFKDFPFAAPGLPFDNLAGNELPTAPPVSFTVGLNYTHDTGLFASASIAYTDSQHTQVLNLEEEELGPGLTEKVGSRTLANARLGYAAGNFTVFIYGTNLFDEDTSRSALLATVGTGTGSIRYRDAPTNTVSAPQTFGFGLDLSF
ncbi:MAG: TonB-dependent receptor [Pseudomonadota bacterium]